jgi:hypothetical protein
MKRKIESLLESSAEQFKARWKRTMSITVRQLLWSHSDPMCGFKGAKFGPQLITQLRKKYDLVFGHAFIVACSKRQVRPLPDSCGAANTAPG